MQLKPQIILHPSDFVRLFPDCKTVRTGRYIDLGDFHVTADRFAAAELGKGLAIGFPSVPKNSPLSALVEALEQQRKEELRR